MPLGMEGVSVGKSTIPCGQKGREDQLWTAWTGPIAPAEIHSEIWGVDWLLEAQKRWVANWVGSGVLGLRGTMQFEFDESLSVVGLRVRVENYSDFGHFCNQLTLSCADREDGDFALQKTSVLTQQRVEWQYARLPKATCGRFWQIEMHSSFQVDRYCEIGQFDMFGA